jgi:hypothetical protein
VMVRGVWLKAEHFLVFNCSLEEGGKWEWQFFKLELLFTPSGARVEIS